MLARGNHPTFENKAPRIWDEILASNQFRESLKELLRPVLPFLAFLFYQGKTSNLPRICSHCRTQKILGKDREYQNNQGNSLLKVNQGNPRNQGMEGQGENRVFT